MIRRISDFFYRLSTGKVTLIALAIFFGFTALVLPGQSTAPAEYPSGAFTPDTSFYYSASDLYTAAEAFGEQGRQDYVRARFTFDLIWPFVYFAFLVTTISWLLGRAYPPGSNWRLLNLLPLLGVLFDFLENIATSLVMVRFPAPTPVLASLAGMFTLSKWIFLGFSFAVLGLGILAVVWRWLAMRRG